MENKKLNLLEKLSEIQNELKAPKGQYNNFGKYKYRSCEDILEALKPILKENRTSLVISDDLENIGERYYIKATATIYDLDSDTTLSNTAYAREEETKKGMDGSQITGTASSYARKYALNGLFNIDDTKDADTDEHHNQVNQNEKQTTKKPTSAKKATVDYHKLIQSKLMEMNINIPEFAQRHKLNAGTSQEQVKELLEKLTKGEIS